MKPKKLFMTICIVCAVCVAGCDDDRSSEHPGTPLPTGPYHFVIEENHDVECCGIKDPLANLEWLQVDTAHDQYLRYWCVYLALDTMLLTAACVPPVLCNPDIYEKRYQSDKRIFLLSITDSLLKEAYSQYTEN